jgi:hypothetical protein
MEATTQRIPSRVSDSLIINWAAHELLYDHVSLPATMEKRSSLRRKDADEISGDARWNTSTH